MIKHGLLLLCVISASAWGGIEVFSKGSLSKNYFDQNTWTVNLSITAGIGFKLIPGLRIEGRYTNVSGLQNRMVLQNGGGTLTDIKTETHIYSMGLDIDFLGEASAIQPFCFLGAGYIGISRSYYYQLQGASSANFYQEAPRSEISGNVGLGVRLRIAKSLALEIEAYGYIIDIDKPDRLINYFGTAGVRVFM